MKKNVTLSIPKPCTENWDHFAITPMGGFCSSCSKNVIDLTKMSDLEIESFFISQPAHACGRFRPDQLKAYTVAELPRIKTGLTLFKAGMVSLLLLLISKPNSTHAAIPKVETEVVQKLDSAEVENKTSVSLNVISGVVKSSDDQLPLPGVNVYLKGTATGTVTDADGRFILHADFKEKDVLVFSFIGYESKEYVIRSKENEGIEVQMTLDISVMGEVAVAGVYEPSPTGVRKLWLKIKAAL